jgi:predicted nucleotidyltransferase
MPGPGDLNRELRRLAEEYALAAREALGDNLVSVVLFGSVARGGAAPGSDIDLLVVCRELPEGAFRRRRLVEPVEERLEPALRPLWERGLCPGFTVLLRTEAEAACFHRVYLDMVEDAVLLYDRDGFFAGVLARLRERLRALGARRRRLGDARYWDLKPDFRPGDVIDL